MINNRTYVIALLMVFLWSDAINSQIIDLQIKIEPEITATVEQDLDFGTLISNSGRMEIAPGDLNVGIFKIRAFHTQNIYLTLDSPDVLRSEDPFINEVIPVDLFLSYSNNGNNPEQSVELVGGSGKVTMRDYSKKINSSNNEFWKELYIYVYGWLEVGNIPNGIYTNDLNLIIDYD